MSAWPFSHKDDFQHILPSEWMTGRLTDRNCNHNDGHSEKDLPFSKSADDCRPISGDFHPRQTNSSRFCYADTHNTFLKHAFQPRRVTVFSHRNPSCRLIEPYDSELRHTGFRDFIASARTHSLHLIFTDLRCQHWHGKVCFEHSKTDISQAKWIKWLSACYGDWLLRWVSCFCAYFRK